MSILTSSPDFLAFVLDLLREAPEVTFRRMMGEYVLYSRGAVFGGIYDDRFLLKVTPSSENAFPSADRVSPYPGAQDMIMVDSEDAELIARTIELMLPEIPTRPSRQRRS